MTREGGIWPVADRAIEARADNTLMMRDDGEDDLSRGGNTLVRQATDVMLVLKVEAYKARIEERKEPGRKPIPALFNKTVQPSVVGLDMLCSNDTRIAIDV